MCIYRMRFDQPKAKGLSAFGGMTFVFKFFFPMTTNNRGFSLIGGLALLTLLVGCAHTAQTENLLSNAGFSTVVAITSRQQQHLMTLQPYKVTVVRRNGKTYYVYADPAHNQIFVGNQFAYDKYRDLRLEKNLAQENLQNIEQSDWSSPGWEVWGPWHE